MATDVARFAARGPLRGTARLPGDKSISHRCLLYAGLAEGTSRLRNVSDGDDVLRTRRALVALGRHRFKEAERVIDMGNSGTGLRLLAGLVAGFDFLTVLQGDHSIHRRPMARIVEPLRAMGAFVDGREQGRLAPLVVRGGHLHGIEHLAEVPSAQVKGAILLAGLSASGTTTVKEKIPTRRHSEELLARFGAPIELAEEDGTYVVRVRAGSLVPQEVEVPADPSQAAFLVVAASLVSGSEILLERVYVGPGRAGFLQVLRRMGASIEVRPLDELTADLIVRHAPLQATVVEGAEVADCIDEIPVLAVAAAFAEGTTTFKDAAELRVKESDRVASVVAGLRAIGSRAEERLDGLVVEGDPGLRPAGLVASEKDHRVAMAFAVAALRGGPVAIEGFSSVATSWPGFAAALDELT
jgi:3-phosphoshikimate 1-carboxyvinyltransferase